MERMSALCVLSIIPLPKSKYLRDADLGTPPPPPPPPPPPLATVAPRPPSAQYPSTTPQDPVLPFPLTVEEAADHLPEMAKSGWVEDLFDSD